MDFELRETQRNIQVETWEKGNFSLLSDTFGADEAERFIDRLDISRGMQALDIACGTGATALPLARLGAEVTGLDIVPKHLAEARARAKAQGLSICFDEGFMEELPYPCETFDVVVSMFGIMFSQKPDNTVAEIARVLRPGGLLAMANWTANGITGAMSRVAASYLPPRLASISPMPWGEEKTVQERLNKAFTSIEYQRIEFDWRIQRDAIEAADLFIKNAGPILAMLGHLSEENRASIRHDMAYLWTQNNTSTAVGETVVKNEYLAVVARRL